MWHFEQYDEKQRRDAALPAQAAAGGGETGKLPAESLTSDLFAKWYHLPHIHIPKIGKKPDVRLCCRQLAAGSRQLAAVSRQPQLPD